MHLKNIIGVILITLGSIVLVLSYQVGVNNASADSGYEGRSEIQGDIYYMNTHEEPIATTTKHVVGEREIAGFYVVKLKPKRKVETIEEPNNRWNITLTNDEIDLLAKIVWIESRGEEDKGQRSVIEVIFNRMIYEQEFKGTLEEVVSQDGQFSSWGDRETAEPTKKEYKNIKKVLDGETDIFDFDTVYFSTEPRNNDIAAHIGGHYFCRYEYLD